MRKTYEVISQSEHANIGERLTVADGKLKNLGSVDKALEQGIVREVDAVTTAPNDIDATLATPAGDVETSAKKSKK